MRCIEKVRLYPTKAQGERLEHILHVTRRLYNALLEQRRDAYKRRNVILTAKQQSQELTALRAEDPVFGAIYREIEDAVLRRLDLAMRVFYRRNAAGLTGGFPRFRFRSPVAPDPVCAR